MVLETADDQLVNIEINNNAAYGYDVRAELVGEKATIAMNAVNYTRVDRELGQSTSYEADWRGRYAEAYRRQEPRFHSVRGDRRCSRTSRRAVGTDTAPQRVAEAGVTA